METTVKQRLKEYIRHKGISVRLFESTCGLSYGYYCEGLLENRYAQPTSDRAYNKL